MHGRIRIKKLQIGLAFPSDGLQILERYCIFQMARDTERAVQS